MSDFISMLMNAEIDADKSVSIINKQIKELSKKIEPIKVKIDIDDNKLKSINKLNDKLNEITNKGIDQNNIKETVKGISLLQDQIDELIKTYSKFGTVRANLSFGKTKDDLQKLTIQLKDVQGKIQEFHYKLNDKGILEKENVDVRLKEILSIQEKIENLSKRQAKELGNVSKEMLRNIGATSDELQKMKEYYQEIEKVAANLANFQQKYLNKADALYAKDILPKEAIQDFESLVKLLDTTAQKADFDMIKNEYKNLVNMEKELINANNERRKEITQTFQEDLKNKKIIFQYEKKLKDFQLGLSKSKIDSSSAEYNELLNAQKNILQTLEQYKNTKKIITDDERLEIDKQIDNLNRLKNTYDEVAKERIRVKKLGEHIGSIKGIDFEDNEAIKRYVLSLQEAGAEITKFQRTTDNLGNSQIKMRVSSKHGTDMLKQQQLIIDENTQSIYKYDESLKPIPGRLFDWANAMKTAMVRSVQWAISMELLYGNLRKLREGVQYIQDLEHETQQIQMVTRMTTAQVNELTRSYSKLADELGSTTLDVTKSATEFFRQGLSVDEVQDRIENVGKLSTVLGLSMEETAEKVTAGVNSMGVETERLGDVVTKVGAIAGTSGEEILTIIQRAGATAKQSGVSLEELATVGAVISEQTRLSAETIGTALNTIFAKFQQVNDITGEINEDYGKVIQAVESVGVSAIDKTTGQLRNVMDILSDLGDKWDSLSKKQQQYITSAMGVRQFNRFATLLQNSTRQMEILAEAQNSQNEMTEQHAIYLQKTEAAAERAKNALQKMWSNTIQSENIKHFYNLSTALINIIDKIGLLKVATIGLSSVILLSNERYKEFLLSLVKSIHTLGQLESSTLSFKSVMDVLNKTFDITKVKALAAKVAIAGLQMVLTFGLSYAISFVVEQIDKLINKYNNLKTANQELVMSYKQNVQANNSNIERLHALSSKYDVIRDKLKNQIELNEEEKQTLNELIAINPLLVQGYDERGNAIIDTTKSINDMIDALKRANEIENIKLVQGGQGLFEQSRKDISKVQMDINRLNNEIIKIQSGIGRVIPFTSLQDLEQINQILGENSRLSKLVVNSIQQKQIALDNLNQKMSVYKQQLESSTTEVKNALFTYAKMSDSYKGLSDELKNVVAEYIRSMNVMNYKDFMDMQMAVDKLTNSLKNNRRVQENINQYNIYKQQFDDGLLSAEEFDRKVKEIINNLLKIPEIQSSIDGDILRKIFKDSSAIKDFNDDVDNTIEQTQILDATLAELTDTFKGVTEKIQDYNKYLAEMNSEEGLSAESKMEIIDKYQELLPYLDDEMALRQQLIQIIEQEGNTQKEVYSKMLDYSQAFYDAKILGNQQLVNTLKEAYGVDLENYKSLAQAKMAVEQRLLQGLSQSWQNYMKFRPKDTIKDMYNEAFRSYSLNPTPQNKAELDEIHGVYQRMQQLNSLFEVQKPSFKSVDFSDINLSRVPKSPGRKSKSKRSPKSKNPKSKFKRSETSYESQISMFRELKHELEDLEHAIERYNKLIDNTSSEEKRMKYLDKTITLYKQQQQQLHKLNNELRYNRNIIGSNAAKQLSDVFTFDQKTGELRRNIKVYNKLSDTRKKTADYYIKLIDDLNNEIDQHSLKWWDVNKTLQDSVFKKMSYTVTIAKDKIAELDFELDKSNFTLQKLNENSKEYRDEQNKQIQILNKKRGVYSRLLIYYQQQLKVQTLNVEQTRQINDEILNIKQAILGLDSEIFSMQKTQQENIKSLLEDADNELKNIQDSIEDLGKQRAFEKLQNDIEESTLALEPFANELELLKVKFDLLDDTDYDGKIDVVAQQFKSSKRYGRQLRREFDRLSKTTTNNSQETDALINALTELQQKIKQNTLDAIEYQKALDDLRIDKIVSEFEDVNQALERELSLIDHNLKMLEDGLLSGTDIVFGVDFALPTIPEDLIEKKRKENEELLKEQEDYEKDILDLKELSLEQQREEQEKHYNESMAELIKHYNEVIEKIKDYLDIELDAHIEHQINVNEEILDGLNTTAENYNDVWSDIVANVRSYLQEIQNMVRQTNQAINSVSSGRGGSSRPSGTYTIGTQKGRDVYFSGGTFSDGARVRDDGLIQKNGKILKPKFLAKGTRDHDGEKALVGEEGEELGILPNGKTVILGRNGAELVDIPKGTQVIPHKETKEILSYTGDIDNEYISKYKYGTPDYKPTLEELEKYAVYYHNYTRSGIGNWYLLPNGDRWEIVRINKRNGKRIPEIRFKDNVIDEYYNYEEKWKDHGGMPKSLIKAREFVDSGKVSKNFEMPWEKTQRAKKQGYFTEDELKSRDNYLTKFVSKKYGYPIFMVNGDIYTEVEDGIYQDAGSIYDEKYDKDDKIRILFGDILESKYPNSTYLDNHNKMMDYIATEIPENASIRQKATGITHMGGYDESLPKDFQQYREERTAIVEQIQKDQQKIIEDIAKGLDVSELKEDVLQRIDEQLQKDVEMQFRIQEDTLRQQIDNAANYLKDIEEQYFKAIDNENLYMANKLSEQYNEAADTYLHTQEKLKNAIKDRYEYEFSLMDKKLDKENQIMDKLEYQKNLIETLNPDNIIGISDTYKEMAGHISDQITYLYEILNQLSEQQSLLEVGSYEWNIINGQVDNVVSKIRSANLEMAKMAKTAFSGFAGKFKDDVLAMNPAPSSYSSPEDDSDKWLEGLEKQLEIEKLMKYVEENKLELNEKQLSVINNQGKIRKKELDVVRKELELQQLLVKIENLRNQKTIQQLTKKEDGTWDFEYVADLDAISDVEDQILDARLAVIHAEKDLKKELQEESEKAAQNAAKSAQDAYESKIKRFEEVLNNAENRMYKSADEFRQALLDIGLEFTEGQLEEIVDNYWKYFIQTAEIFIREALDRTNQLLNQQAKAFESAGNKHGVAYIKGLSDGIEEIMQGEGDIIEKQKTILDLFANEYAKFAIAGNKAGMEFINGLIDSMATVDYELEFDDIASHIRNNLLDRSQTLKDLGQEVGSAFVAGLVEAIDEIINDDTIENKTQAILDLLNKADEYGALGQALGEEFVQELSDTIVNLTDEVEGEGESALSTALNTMINMLDDKIADFAERGDIQGVAYAEALKTQLEKALTNAELTQQDIIDLLSKFKDFNLAGLLSGDAYNESLTEGMKTTKDNVDESSSIIVQGLEEEVEKFGEAGKHQGEAYKESITNAFQDAVSIAMNLVDNLVSYINSKKFNVNVGVNGASSHVESFDTGGYTGSWGSSGKLAILHEKELVLNKTDTENLLNAINISKDIIDNIKIPTMPKTHTVVENDNKNQIFNIDKLEFPGVDNAEEIKEAIINLPNTIRQKIK